jgi:hypothetical protein
MIVWLVKAKEMDSLSKVKDSSISMPYDAISRKIGSQESPFKTARNCSRKFRFPNANFK